MTAHCRFTKIDNTPIDDSIVLLHEAIPQASEARKLKREVSTHEQRKECEGHPSNPLFVTYPRQKADDHSGGREGERKIAGGPLERLR